MILNTIRKTEQGVNITITRNGERIRKVNVVFGKEYISNPVNPLKKKHRDRVFIAKAISKDNQCLKVIFKDTNRIGNIDFEDIAEI